MRHRTPWPRALLSRGLLSAALIFALAACDGTPAALEFDVPLHRFSHRPQTSDASASPNETIGGEIRPVFRAPKSAFLSTKRKAGGGRQQANIELPDAFADAARALVKVSWRRGAHYETVVPIARDSAGRARARVLLRAATQTAKSLAVTALRLPDGGVSAEETEAMLVPDRARLEFAIGIHEIYAGRPELEFRLSVCEGEQCTEEFRETLTAGIAQNWHDRSLALDAYAGREVRLRLESRLIDGSPKFAALPLWTPPTLYAPAAAPPGRRNVILISLDTLSADHLDVYGYEHPTAPFMASEFGAGGVVFENAVAASTVTGPSHMSLFTSMLPSAHGLGARPSGETPPLRSKLLGELLHEAGFRTGAFTENAAIYSADGFSRGFDEYFEMKGRHATPTGHIREIFARGTSWWQRHRGKARFLFLHTYQPHAPYLPSPGDLQKVFGEGAAGNQRNLYDAGIRTTDDALRDFVEELRSAGDLEDTVLIVVSDHGEEFGEHGFTGHGITLHSEMVHVPLFVSGADIPRGERVASPVSHVDVMPTILEIAAVAVAVGAPDDLRGESLVSHWDGSTPDGEPRPVFSESWVPSGYRSDRTQIFRSGPGLAVRVGNRKLVRYAQPLATRTLYFDLASDPQERRDLSADAQHGDSVRELNQLLDELVDPKIDLAAKFQRGKVRGSSGGSAAPMDAERAEKLRALGYVE